MEFIQEWKHPQKLYLLEIIIFVSVFTTGYSVEQELYAACNVQFNNYTGAVANFRSLDNREIRQTEYMHVYQRV